MLERLFPKTLEGGYRGHPVARWVLIAFAIVTAGRSLVHIFFADGGAQSIATIPLDTYSSGGAASVVTLMAMWGLSQLIAAFVYIVVLWRYPALIPLVWVLFVFEWGGRLLIGAWKPLDAAGTPPGAVGNLMLPFVGVAMLALSLRERPAPEP
ncbi:MAG: hypothetical protein CL910_08285 [Deltaproteobacteria bacterium]|nr:hypothetical protein [Deltaproteobacteria bacterium]